MKKSRAIFLLIALVVIIGGYVAWAAWNPDPTLQSMRFHTNVGPEDRKAAEADFREHPPKAGELTWKSFGQRLVDPYRSRVPTIPVRNISFGSGVLIRGVQILYPREDVLLVYDRKSGRWVRKSVRPSARG